MDTFSSLTQQLQSERDAHAAATAKLNDVSTKVTDTCEQLSTTKQKLLMLSAKEAEIDSMWRERTERIRRELRTLRKRDAELEAWDYLIAFALAKCFEQALPLR
jgi:predicted  nucleic acid-binding Zn-ribbon protein